MSKIKAWQPEFIGSRASASDGGVENYKWQTGEDALFKAVSKDDVYSVSQLILAGADMNACNKSGMTALMVAAEHNAKNVAALLIKAGAKVDAFNNEGLTALQIAAGSDSIDVVVSLIKAGADVNAKTADGQTALSFSIENKAHEIMILLLAAGARPELLKKKEDASSLGLGAGQGECNESKSFSDGEDAGNGSHSCENDSGQGEGGDLSYEEEDDDDKLNLKILSYLPGPVAKSAPLPKNLVGTLYGGHGGNLLAMETSFTKESKPTGVSHADPGKTVRIFKNLDPFIKDEVDVPLEEASVLEDYTKYKGKKPEDKKADEDINVSQSYKEARIKHEHEEIRKRYSWIEAARKNDTHIANLLTVAEADINEKDRYGQSALMYAVSQNLLKGVKLLLKAGADVNLKNARDETVLMRAAFKNFPEMLSLLIKNGADVKAKDISGWTAMKYATKKKSYECIKILEGAGSRI